MSRGLWYGQIRPTNYSALCQVYGYFPPWPMTRSPHVDLVHALAEGRDPSKTAFADYLRLTGRPDLLLERVNVLRGLMASEGPFEIDTCCNSVLDGNHRSAVAIVRGQQLIHHERQPYQTINIPGVFQIDGRRFDDRFPIDYDFSGKVVLDLGARDGMNAVHALKAGASKCILVDNDFTSLTWQVMHVSWFHYWQYDILPADLRELEPIPCDVVLAFSIRGWIGDEALAKHIAGKDCLLETHTEEETPPDTGHAWTLLKEVSYSRAEPDRKRRLYLGRP